MTDLFQVAAAHEADCLASVADKLSEREVGLYRLHKRAVQYWASAKLETAETREDRAELLDEAANKCATLNGTALAMLTMIGSIRSAMSKPENADKVQKYLDDIRMYRNYLIGPVLDLATTGVDVSMGRDFDLPRIAKAAVMMRAATNRAGDERVHATNENVAVKKAELDLANLGPDAEGWRREELLSDRRSHLLRQEVHNRMMGEYIAKAREAVVLFEDAHGSFLEYHGLAEPIEVPA